MKKIDQLSKDYAENWTKPRLQDAEIAALSQAYISGYEQAVEEAIVVCNQHHAALKDANGKPACLTTTLRLRENIRKLVNSTGATGAPEIKEKE